MGVHFWAARVHSSKQSSGNYITTEDEGSGEVRAWFPCPYCYVEIELQLLCVHLQEEHCFDLKNAVCPICAANLGKDALSHFTVHHAHSVNRRKKNLKSGFWSNISADIVRDFRELSSFLGSNNNSGQGRSVSNNEAAPDPLLSPFICAVPLNENQHIADIDDDDAERFLEVSNEFTASVSSQESYFIHFENITFM